MSTPIEWDENRQGHIGGHSLPISYEVDGASVRLTFSGTESTSAQLRSTQEAWAATQADLTRVERERDEARAQLAKPCGQCHPCENYGALQDSQAIADTNDLLRDKLAAALADGDRIAMRLMDTTVERDLARAELATATAELTRLRAQTGGGAQ